MLPHSACGALRKAPVHEKGGDAPPGKRKEHVRPDLGLHGRIPPRSDRVEGAVHDTRDIPRIVYVPLEKTVRKTEGHLLAGCRRRGKENGKEIPLPSGGAQRAQQRPCGLSLSNGDRVNPEWASGKRPPFLLRVEAFAFVQPLRVLPQKPRVQERIGCGGTDSVESLSRSPGKRIRTQLRPPPPGAAREGAECRRGASPQPQ